MPKTDLQINIPVDLELKNQLIRIARIRSVEQDRTVSYIEMIREILYQLVNLSGSFPKL